MESYRVRDMVKVRLLLGDRLLREDSESVSHELRNDENFGLIVCQFGKTGTAGKVEGKSCVF